MIVCRWDMNDYDKLYYKNCFLSGENATFVEKTISITLIKLCKPMISCLIQELENVKDQYRFRTFQQFKFQTWEFYWIPIWRFNIEQCLIVLWLKWEQFIFSFYFTLRFHKFYFGKMSLLILNLVSIIVDICTICDKNKPSFDRFHVLRCLA